MNILNIIIKSILPKDSELLFFSNFGGKVIVLNYKDINKAFIKSNNNIIFYLLIFAVIISLFLVSLLFLPIRICFCVLIFLLCIGWYFIKYNSYYIIIRLDNELEYKLYFSRNKKYEMIEKVKIIRGKIQESSFVLNV